MENIRNLVVFLHNKGFHCDMNKELVSKIAKQHQAKVFSFNAPLKYKNGYSWFSKDENKQVVISSFESAIWYAIDIINEKLQEEGLSWKDVILVGHSQGGAIAIYLGIMKNVAKIISICGDLPYNLDYTNEKFSRTVPIFWVEAAKDTCLSDERKNSYILLVKENYTLKVAINPKSSHGYNDYLDDSILDQI